MVSCEPSRRGQPLWLKRCVHYVCTTRRLLCLPLNRTFTHNPAARQQTLQPHCDNRHRGLREELNSADGCLPQAYAREGERVGWVDRDSSISAYDLRRAVKGETGPRVVAIDDADIYGASAGFDRKRPRARSGGSLGTCGPAVHKSGSVIERPAVIDGVMKPGVLHAAAHGRRYRWTAARYS